MRLLFLTDNFPPEVNAPANRTYEHCKEWVKAGVAVTVITGFPNFPKGKVYDGYTNKLYQVEWVDGIKVVRVWTYITANEGFVKRILDYISFAIMAFFAGLFKSCDLIVATSPQFFTAMAGSALAFVKRKKWVMEVRDLWPESIVAVGAMEKNRFIRFFERVEKNLYHHATKIVVVTDAFKQKIIQRGIDAHKIVVHKNGANLEIFKPIPKPVLILQKYPQLQNKFVIAYIGTHGLAHGLDFVLHCAQNIQQELPNVFFLFMGDGANKQKLQDLAKELNLQNVLFLESVAKKEVNDYLNSMDVALVNLKKSDTFLTVIPSKIFEAAAAEKPILLGLQGETKGIITHYQAGICYEPENTDEFIEAIRLISTDKLKYNTCKLGCKQLSTDFDRKKIAHSMLQDLKSKELIC